MAKIVDVFNELGPEELSKSNEMFKIETSNGVSQIYYDGRKTFNIREINIDSTDNNQRVFYEVSLWNCNYFFTGIKRPTRSL